MMWMRSVATVVVSVVLSVSVTLYIERIHEKPFGDTVRAKAIELVDEQGKLRGSFRLVGTSHGKMQPEIVLLDDNGQAAASLSVGPTGDGELFIGMEGGMNESSANGPRAMHLGHLILSDTTPVEESMRGWGLIVLNKNQTALLGVSDAGKSWGVPDKH